MLIGIDGTGPELLRVNSWDKPPEYENLMKDSFVNQLAREYRGQGKGIYFRGSSVTGVECPSIANLCMITARIPLVNGHPVYLAGYSRGGAIAIAVAKQIRKEFPKARIPAIALFDAVDRERCSNPYFGDLRTIPGNVDQVFHAMREPIVRSRSYFGNCGVQAVPPCQFKKLTFVTTHGGMGWVPLGDSAPFEEKWRLTINAGLERQQSKLVHQWMWANLRKVGIVP